MRNKGRSVRLYLVDGVVTGILTAEIINWTGHALAGPRVDIKVALEREELNRTGVYLLYGDGSDGDLPSIYVGEGDSVKSRLREHVKSDDKDFWDRFVAITSKDLNLTKAHVRYLESRLISLLKDAKKTAIRNRTEPIFEKLPEADIADMEAFLEEVQLLLPVIGVDFLRRPKIELESRTGMSEQVEFYLQSPVKGIQAKAVEVGGEFIVLSASTGTRQMASSCREKIRLLRDQVLESGRALVVDEKIFRLTEDIAFSSPSAASDFLHGTSRNGRVDWLVYGTGETYSDFKSRQIS